MKLAVWKLLLWFSACAHITCSILIYLRASHLKESESKERGIFVFKSSALGLRRDLTNPIGNIGDGVTQVVSEATQVAGEASTAAMALPTELSDIGKVELDVGTESLDLHIGGDQFHWEPATGVDKIPDLPQDLGTPITGVKTKLKTVASMHPDSAIIFWICLSIFSSCVYLGLTAATQFPSGRRRQKLGFIAALTFLLVSNGLICGLFWVLYWCINLVLSLGSKLDKLGSVDSGPASSNALYSSLLSTAQSVLSVLACFLYSCVNRQTQLHKRETAEGPKASSSQEVRRATGVVPQRRLVESGPSTSYGEMK